MNRQIRGGLETRSDVRKPIKNGVRLKQSFDTAANEAGAQQWAQIGARLMVSVGAEENRCYKMGETV